MPEEHDAHLEELEPAAAEEAPAEEAPPASPDAPTEEAQAEETQAVEVWATLLTTPAWLFAAAKMHAQWPIGRHVTRAAYEAALEGVASVTCR